MIPAPIPTHGTLVHRAGWWLIAAEPHALMRLRRWVGRLDADEHDQLRLRRSPEVDRDLQCFLDRFPLEMSAGDARLLHMGAEAHRAMGRTVAAVAAGTFVARAFDLAVPPRDYQRIAADLWLHVRAMILGDDMGLGKTATAIAGLSDPATRPALVVTLTHLPEQWRREIDRFCPGMRILILDGTKPYDVAEAWARQETRRTGRRVAPAFPDVLITTYHRIAGWAEALAPKLRGLVYDEVQELRHNDTAKYKAAAHLSAGATYRIGLSATPIHNYGGEFFNVVEAVRPGALGSREEFVREWCVSGEEERKTRVRDTRAFGLYLRESGIMLRRTRKEVGRELPPLTVVPHHIEADLAALDRVAGSAAELARIIIGQRTSNFDRMKASGDLDRLMRQATGIAKAPYIADFVQMLVESGERPVVYLWHREVYAIVQAKLRELKPSMFTGSETTVAKRENLRRFTSGETPVLLMSLRSGAGVDGLQLASRTVVIGELDWSPVVHDQAIGRVDRDGQPDKVVAYYLLADVGSDPTVADACGAKAAQSGTIRDPRRELVSIPQVDPGRVRQLAEAFLASRAGRRR